MQERSTQPSRDETLSFCWSTIGEEPGEAPAETTADYVFAVGDLLEDRYRLVSVLGHGAMGQVFLAQDTRLNRRVAIKVISYRFDLPPDTEVAEKRLAEEAKLGASLQHPNIAAVLDFGFAEGLSFTVFEFVEGETLRQIAHKRQRLPLAELRPIVGQLARALDYAHAKGIVHRDLKPENVCATISGQFKVLDLGLARNLLHTSSPQRYSGTPSYSSPEQASCQPIDGRSDQYSLAILTYELLTGSRPFKANKWAEMLLHQIRTPVTDPRELGVALEDDVVQAMFRALSKNPDERFATCQEFAKAIGDTSGPTSPVVNIKEEERFSFYLCHAPEDSIVASKLAQGLEEERFSCWLYQRDALPGVSLNQQAKAAMTRCNCALILISRAFVDKPLLVEEIAQIHQLGRVLFPVLIDMSQEEFDAQKNVWRSMLGPSVLVPMSSLEDLRPTIERIVNGAEAAGIERQLPKASTPLAPSLPLAGRIWATDANQIDILDLERVVFRTEVIDDFLHRRNKNFLSASKGLGKTLLLTYKRHLLTQNSKQTMKTIPEGRPYLDFMSELRTLSEKYQRPLSDLNTTKRLWSAALRISAISHHDQLIHAEEAFELEACPQRIRRWILGAKIQPTVVFKELTSLRVSELNRFIDDTENFLDQKMRGIHSGTSIFVDKVDQAIRQLPRQAWINVQAGLIEAAWEMMNANSHLRIFATIREEAFVNYESDVKSNLFGATTRLQYSENELAQMMDQLAACYEGSRGFRDFVGLNVIRHAKRPDPEDSFQFLRRHTFGRPRDLVAMCSELSAKRSSLSEDRFRQTVYETSATSLVSNVFDEVRVFMTCLHVREDRLRFLASIPQNVLTRQEAIEICEQFNGLEPGTLQTLGEDSAYIYHPFRDLFLAGLLGVIEEDLETGHSHQKFRQPNDVLQDVGFELPESDFYLIHSALNSFIDQLRSQRRYQIFQQVVIGHGLRWDEYYGMFCEAEKQISDLGYEHSAGSSSVAGAGTHVVTHKSRPIGRALYREHARLENAPCRLTRHGRATLLVRRTFRTLHRPQPQLVANLFDTNRDSANGIFCRRTCRWRLAVSLRTWGTSSKTPETRPPVAWLPRYLQRVD